MPGETADEVALASPVAAHRTSAVLALVAGTALFCELLVNSPSRFSERHAQDQSWLRPVVSALALGGAFPTVRGVEIRSLVFYAAAALLAAVAGAHVVLSRQRPRLLAEDLLELRERAASPHAWWVLFLLVSLLSSVYSHAPEACEGQTVIHFLHAAWWFPLAALLVPRDAARLATGLFAALTLTGAVGLWYFLVRVRPFTPDARLQYPLGNELWLAACLLPGPFIGFGLLQASRRRWWPLVGWSVATAVLLVALSLTRSRSAAFGVSAGGLTILVLMTRGRVRRVTLLVALTLVFVAGMGVERLRQTGIMGERAHSIRARLNYEWPYALLLFARKPLTGHGDGAFAMLAGQYARDHQLDDPGVIRFDETSWLAHAHNEILELAADLGLVGVLSFSIPLGLTLWWTVRFCDRRRKDADAAARRGLAIGLGGALVAMLVDACGNPALREPGYPPVFLTAWALLWRLTRDDAPVPGPAREKALAGAGMARLGGLAIVVVAGLLGWQGIRDWQGARARREAEVALLGKDYPRAIEQADRAAERLLDVFQGLQARMIAVWGRSLLLDQKLRDPRGVPTNETMEIARAGLMRLSRLQRDAPRFLRVSRLESELCLNLSRACEKRGDAASQREFHARFIRALGQSRADEPFLVDRVQALWQARPDVTSLQRLRWLRPLLRNGEIDQPFLQLFRPLQTAPDFKAALDALADIARKDAACSADDWQDHLSPETVRVQALARALQGRPDEAAALISQAVTMYERAGPRLFAAHAAALHEWVRYSFAADPVAGAEEKLSRLARAQAILAAPATATTPLPDGLGQTRLRVLLAAGREDAAADQIKAIGYEAQDPMPRRLAKAYLELAQSFADDPKRSPSVARWRSRAAALAPG